MKRLLRLCNAARALHSSAEVTLISFPGEGDKWSIRLSVGSVIFFETVALPLGPGLEDATRRLRSLSQRTLKAMVDPKPEEDLPVEPDSTEPITMK